MKDALGQELKIGDRVAYRPSYNNDLFEARIIGFTPKGAQLVHNEEAYEKYGQWTNRLFSYIAKIERQPDGN